jgi:endonuclease/exonuclease/phosphatase family metal-dependent hydrolase
VSAPALRVASYNIHAGIGSDGRFEPARLIHVLKRLEADIIGLQEVVTLGPDGAELLNALAEECDMQAIAGPTMMRGDAHYGNALLTRHEVTTVQRLDLSVEGYEPRGALAVELAGDRGITVAVTHLGLKAGERAAQLSRLLDWLPAPPRPLVLLGDLNEWRPWSHNLQQVARRFGRHIAPRTFPARWPLLALDRILIADLPCQETPRAFRDSPAKLASDHLPLVAEIKLR